MAAYEIPNLRFSGMANELIARRRFVTPVNDTEFKMADAGEVVIGVSMNDPKENEVLEIADGIVMVEAGATLTAGTVLAAGTNGVAVGWSSGNIAGVCLTGGDNGELITVKIS